jgi:hypothetical protein
MGFSVIAFGQKFQGGVFAGINASRIQNDQYSGFKKLGLHGGGFVQREITGELGWKMELKYAARGMYHHPTQQIPSIQISNITYIELPLSITYLYNEKVEVELGVAPDVLLSEYYEDEDGPLDPSYSADLRKFGLNGFVGINYYLHERVAVGIRYTTSAIPFYTFDYWTNRYFASGYFHNVISVGMKYFIIK